MKPKMKLFGQNIKGSRLEEIWHPPYGEAWWWQHHAVGIFFSGRDWETSQDRRKEGRTEQSTERSLIKTCSGVLRTRAKIDLQQP